MHPAKATGQNEMPFGRDTPVVPSNIVQDRGSGLHPKKWRFGGPMPHFAAMPPSALAVVVCCTFSTVDRLLDY